MLIQLSEEVQREIETAIRSKLGSSLVVNVYETAAEIQQKHVIADLTLDEIAASIAKLAVQRGCAVEFGRGRADTEACS
jgi:hypothetical protein